MKCRKLLAILLALVMVIGLLPFAALAAGDPPVPQAGGHHDDWVALDESTSSWKLEDGSYYLDENLDLDQQVTIQGDVTLCLNGCTLKAPPSASGAVKVSEGASLTICDCGNGGEITSACSNTNPTLHVYGTCTLKSGAITVEDATASGGCAVRINKKGVFTMTGGSLVGGKYGVYNRNVANLNGGTVSGVTAGAANETNPGRLNVAGSAIESSAGAAISLDYGSLDMTSGSASGAAADIELATSKRNNHVNIVLRIAGGSAGRIVHRSDYPLYLSGAPTVTSVELASVENQLFASENRIPYNGSAIAVSLQDPPEVGETVIRGISKNADRFTYAGENFELKEDGNGNLILQTPTTAPEHANHGQDGTGIITGTWQVWDQNTNVNGLTSGYYYLTENISLGNDIAYISRNADVHICLNGHSISSSSVSGTLIVGNGASVSICDCQGDGAIAAEGLGTIVVNPGATLNFYSGTITNNNGSGIVIELLQTENEKTIANMYGGTIDVGKIGISNNGGTVNVYDGNIIYDNYAGVFTDDARSVTTIQNGTIAPRTNATRGDHGVYVSEGTLYLTGAVNISGKSGDIKINHSNAVFASKDEAAYSGDLLNIYFSGAAAETDPIILNVTSENAALFELVWPLGKALVRDSNNNLVLGTKPVGHKAHDADGTGSIPEGKEWIAWDGSTQMNAPGYYYLDKNVTLTSTIEVTADVHLCLNGYEMSDNGKDTKLIIVNRGASLTICDCSEDETGTINYKCTTEYAINNYGALTLYSGKIYSTSGNGIRISSVGASNIKFDMEGGTIDVGGTGISFSIGNEVNIKGGTLIYGGQTGVLFAAEGTLTVSGRTIRPRENGDEESRGIIKTGTGDLFVTGGNISGKENGIRVIGSKSGAVTISGGNISASGEQGYGIYLYETATANLYLSDAPTISGKMAALYIGKPNTVYAGKENAAYDGSALDIYYAGDAATEDPIILNVTEDNANSFNLNYPTNKTLEHRGDNLYLADEILPMPELTVTVDPNPLTYGQTAQATVSGEPSGASISYEIIESEPAGVASIGTDGAITTNGVGTFKVKVTVSATGYSDGEATSAEITVNKATPTPEAPTGLTATYGDTLEDIDLPTGWTWKNPETSVGNVGSHEFDAIYQETPEKYYNSVPMKLSVEVTPKSISGASIELGDSLRYTGEEQTQTVDSVTLDGVALDPKDYTLTNNKATDVGTYTLTITGTGNYNGTVTKQWSIAKAAPTVTDPTAKTDLVYTGAAQELVTAGTATGGTMVYSLSENGTYAEAIPEGTYAGDYTVWYKVKGDGNHSDTAPQSIEVSIGKAKLTVKANDLSINEGSPVPTYTASYSGFVNGETETDLSGKLTFTCSYTQNSQPSTYDIKPSGLTSDNYAITFQNGTLTVVAVGEILPPVAKDLTYTGKAQKLIDPAQAADDVDLFYSLDLQHFYRTIPEATNAGTYTVYWEAKKDGTTVDNGSLTVTIKKAPLTVTADDIWVYAGNTPKFTATIKGYVNGEDWHVLKGELTFTCGYSQKYSKPGSRYTITPKGLTADNYDITFNTGTLTVKDPLSPRFNVYVLDSKHGTVEADCRYARKGDVVTLTIKPDWGYELETLTVTDSHGYELKLTYHSNGTYTFTMPRDNVTVKAIFTVRDMPFVDVPGDAWYAGGVRYVYAHGLMNGTGNWRFSPNRTTTRAMIATILYRMEGSPRVYGTSQFGDVEAGSWYEDAVIWATQNDIVEGYTSKTFGPNDPITREQMAAMLYRYADYCRCDMSAGRYVDLSKYSDMNEISDYAIPALRWAVGEEIIQGRTGKRLAPTDTATRAEVAVMLMRFCEDVIW